MLQNKYKTYEEACKHFNTESLENRRVKLCLKFAYKEYKKDDQSILKKFNPKVINRHTNKKIVVEYQCFTERYFKSSIPYISRLLNEDNARKLK